MLFVKDSGIGIPEKDIPNLFNDFYRGSNAKKLRETGTGIGLSYIKNIIEKLGGELTFETKENEGSKFIATFPLVEN
ncbi:MAG: ATP-binding protein [Verrucomicrobiota bacterium]|nr:ATP-binding protein [Verrucomicrobiota bacterium]